MRFAATLTLVLISLSLFSQTEDLVSAKLKHINTLGEFDNLRYGDTDWDTELVEVNLDDPKVNPKFALLKKGEQITLTEGNDKFVYKIISKERIKEFRVSHLYLDIKVLSISEIESLREMILEKYANGVAFSDLCRKYAHYSKPGDGDLKWFKENTMVKDFEDAIRKHKKGDIFTVDIPDEGWYYVVLKTFNDRESILLNAFKVKCNN